MYYNSCNSLFLARDFALKRIIEAECDNDSSRMDKIAQKDEAIKFLLSEKNFVGIQATQNEHDDNTYSKKKFSTNTQII